MNRAYYSDSIQNFVVDDENRIIGELVRNHEFATEQPQIDAWLFQIRFLKEALRTANGSIHFEYSIPRMGKRIDVVVVVESVIFVLEFKVGEADFLESDSDQVWDYALDLKNFHETSHDQVIAPILIATEAPDVQQPELFEVGPDGLFVPIRTNPSGLLDAFHRVLQSAPNQRIDIANWISGRYSPTPTIIEAATTLYRQHSVEEISRSDALAKNLKVTSSAVSEIIAKAKTANEKAICFVTGVPGAGKTLVGLDIATKYLDSSGGSQSIFLSGNGPLVAILTEALARDAIFQAKQLGKKVKKHEARSNVKAFIQNVHHYRDEYLKDTSAPIDHVAIFDEAQRAWNHNQTAIFMKRKKKVLNFSYSEPEFLISCLDRHKDWAVIVCLVGGGQEINRGEAGIGEWIESIARSFSDWKIYVSDRLTDSEYDAVGSLKSVEDPTTIHWEDKLHLGVSMRSFRAESVSSFVKNVLDLEIEAAKADLAKVHSKYPIVLTRNLDLAKKWLRERARGSER